MMLLHVLKRPNIRLFLALFSFISSSVVLVLMFRDPFPALDPRPAAEAKEAKAKEKAEEDALHTWRAYNDSVHDGVGSGPPPTEPPFGDVVIAGQESTNLSWTAALDHEWNFFQYDANQPDNPDPRLRFPKRKGNEVVVYLSYILDNWDKLPWSTFFVHGHAEAWHQEADIASLIENLDREQLARYGYISLRCEWLPSCPAEIRPEAHDAVIWGNDPFRAGTEAAVGGNWKLLFPDDKLPQTMASPCCAQFAVTRAAIRRRPKEDYERFLHWLLGSLLDNDLSGRVFEKLWAYIFTGEAV